MKDLRKYVNLSIEDEEERPNNSIQITRDRIGHDQEVAVQSTDRSPLVRNESMWKWEEEWMWREKRE